MTLIFLKDGLAFDVTRKSLHCASMIGLTLTVIRIRDDPAQRTLTARRFSDQKDYAMTIWICTNYCIDQNQALAGLKDGIDCCECTSRRYLQSSLYFHDFVVLNTHFWIPVCGNVLTDSSTIIVDEDFHTPCYGDTSQYCGGLDSLGLYSNGAPLQASPTMPQYVDSWTLQGCFKKAYTL